MTIAELIDLLKTHPPDMEVWIDGGDWAGEVNSAALQQCSGLAEYLLLSNDEE